jgi:iron(III) transport system ATP-binding protein
MASVSIQQATKRFGDVTAVDRVDLNIAGGEFIALLGPSGCGKTTLLRLLGGFERLDGGAISFDGRTVADDSVHVPAEHRRVGMVFQSYALWPHMSVAENVGYPLRVLKTPKQERHGKIAAALALVGLENYAARRPAELSGGQRQRVALARCLAMEPALVLLDEPLANLDIHLRESMQAEFRRFHASTGATMVYVTHDQAEAMALADRVVVIDNGVVQQTASPRVLYRCPETAMVARFIGHGMVRRAEILGADGEGYCRARLWGAEARVRCADSTPGEAEICLRAEHLKLVEPGPDSIAVTVRDAIYRGAATTVQVRPVDDSENALPLSLNVSAAETPPPPRAKVHVAIQDAWRIPR